MMARPWMLLLLLQAVLSSASHHHLRVAVASLESDAVSDVLSRMPAWVADQFQEIILGERSGHLEAGECKLTASDHGLTITANAAVDALYCVHMYIREFCNSMVTWEGVNFEHVRHPCSHRPAEFTRSYQSPMIRYFGNPCTYSYSFAWWTWKEWEPFIDWLALSGFNMVLSPVGQEALWLEVWKDLGVSEDGALDFFTNPAYLAWHRMGNLKSLGGRTSAKYWQTQLTLAKQINARLNQLGIVPVLPTFAGFVPDEYARNHPELEFTRSACWLSFNEKSSCLYFLNSREAFSDISQRFIAKQKEAYGRKSSSVFAADPFNEISPKDLTTTQVSTVAKNIYRGCMNADKHCVWMIQSWMFSYGGWTNELVSAFLDVVPIGRLLVLDLWAEMRPLYREYNHFNGHSFIWCLLHNFGGNGAMRGNLVDLNRNYTKAQKETTNMVGAGLTMEAINQNYVVYQYMIDRFWNGMHELRSLAWFPKYVQARYGMSNTVIVRAWRLLLATYYRQPVELTDHLDPQYEPEKISEPTREADERRMLFIYNRPTFNGTIRLWFKPEHLDTIHSLFDSLNNTLGNNVLFRQDFGDVMVEKEQYRVGNSLVLRLYEGYGVNDTRIMKSACEELEKGWEAVDVAAFRDINSWLFAARDAGTTASESDAFEKAARNQVTIWGSNGEVIDYARKTWGGIVRNYYSKRWMFFCDHIQKLGANHFNQTLFNHELFEAVEKPFGGL